MAPQVCLHSDAPESTKADECFALGLKFRVVGKDYKVTHESDRNFYIDWKEKSFQPFWIHETAVSETFEHVRKKAKKYVHGTEYYVTFISILNMENRSRPGQPEDWRVDLSIWRIDREEYPDGTHKPRENKILDRVQVYPTSNTPLTITVSKHDLVTWPRDPENRLHCITMEIVLDTVYETAERAVDAVQSQNLNLPSGPRDPDQLPPSSPFSTDSDDEQSYENGDGSEEGISQRSAVAIRPRGAEYDNSPNYSEETSGSEEASIRGDSEADDGSSSSQTGEPAHTH